MFVLFLVLLVSVVPASGQVWNDEYQAYSYKGDDIPKYLVVETFYRNVMSFFTNGEVRFKKILDPLGIEYGSESARTMLMASIEAHEILGKDLQLGKYIGDREEFDRVQFDGLRVKVREIKRVYSEMLLKLKQQGVEPDLVEEYLYTEVRPGLSVSVWPEPGTGVAIMREFEEP